MRRVSYILLVLALFAGCGKRAGFNQPGATESSVQLYLFSAQWCDTCKAEMIEIDQAFDTDLAALKDRVKVTVWVVTDKDKFSPPTEASVVSFKAEMDAKGVFFPMQVDPFPFENYSLYFEFTGGDIPAAVVLTEEGEVLKSFAPGQFTTQDVLDKLEQVLGE